jgi:hypothetical protein
MGEIKRISDAEMKRMESDIARLRRYEALMAEYFSIMARHRKNAFDAHVEAGFTEKQALELVRDITEV